MFAPQKQNIIVEDTQTFKVKLLLDEFSKRAWVKNYAYHDPAKLARFIAGVCSNHGLEKIIFPVRAEHYDDLKGQGFSMEGWIDGYFNGQTAYFLTYYLKPERSISPRLTEYMDLVRQISERSHRKPHFLPCEHQIVTPTTRDIPALTSIFKKVFATYPSPVDQPDYLAAVLGKTALFKAVRRGQDIISVAAAEVDWAYRNAELTNCATLPASRGSGLMSGIIAALESECLARGIKCLYSLARASSYGMNLVFHRLGYRYRGTLINNCHISGAYEDMNIWVKYAR